MLTYLQIERYESHLKTVLELLPGINAIVGHSDHGKSGLLRALKWATFNRPLGDHFACDKAEGEEVRVFVSNEDWNIVRIKGDTGFNGYTLDSRKETKRIPYEFDKIGTSVPEQVKQALNLSDVNYQSQLSEHYLIRESPGEVGRVINDSAKLVEIDQVMKWFEKELRDSRSKIKYLSEDLAKKEEEIKEYDGIEEIEAKINGLIELRERVDEKKEFINRINQHWLLLESKELEQGELINYLDRTKIVPNLLERIIDITKRRGKLSDLVCILNQISLFEVEEKEIGKKLDDLINRKNKVYAEFEDLLIAIGQCPYCGGEVDQEKAKSLLKGDK